MESDKGNQQKSEKYPDLDETDMQDSASAEDISLDVCLEYDNDNIGEDEEAIHQRIEDLCQRIEEKQKIVKLKREELRNLEVDSDVEVFEMKHEIVSLQTKIEDDDGTIIKKLAGKGWRNSVMQRRIYGR